MVKNIVDTKKRRHGIESGWSIYENVSLYFARKTLIKEQIFLFSIKNQWSLLCLSLDYALKMFINIINLCKCFLFFLL